MTVNINANVENVLSTTGPEVSDHIFEGHPESVFWVGQVATRGKVTCPEYYEPLTRFRAETYLALGFITANDIDEHGREINADEIRSTSFAVVKKQRTAETETANMEGSGRLIFKEDPNNSLPIEKLFPEVFPERSLPNDTIEVSRFIARDPDLITRHMISLAVIRSITYSSLEARASALYCVIENPLLRLLGRIGIPLEVIGEPKDIPSEGGTLYPVHIFPDRILESVKTDKTGVLDLQAFFNKDIQRGFGHYPGTLLNEGDL